MQQARASIAALALALWATPAGAQVATCNFDRAVVVVGSSAIKPLRARTGHYLRTAGASYRLC